VTVEAEATAKVVFFDASPWRTAEGQYAWGADTSDGEYRVIFTLVDGVWMLTYYTEGTPAADIEAAMHKVQYLTLPERT
jgi:hypothetical protein